MNEENAADIDNYGRGEDIHVEQTERKIVRWRMISQAAGTPIPRPRHGHRALVVKDLIVVLGGGNEGMINDTSVYNTQKSQWLSPQQRGDLSCNAAAFGAVVLGMKIYTFGGMLEYGKYSNQLMELNTARWEWRTLTTQGELPRERLGHSFVASEKTQMGYVFGGLANEVRENHRNAPRYLNDFYMIDLSGKTTPYVWKTPATNGTPPKCRESHTAVLYETENVSRMVVYGGMDGIRLGDLWYMDLNTFTWSEIKFDDPRHGIPPVPRSLHSAVLIDDKMYVYGGWVPILETAPGQLEKEWKCTNNLACWNMTTDKWDPLHLHCYDEDAQPRGRAGHCAAAVGHRMFVWSGRDGYRKAWSNQVCCRDMWLLDTVKPEQPGKVALARAGFQSLDVAWPAVQGADLYFLQIGFGDPKELSVSPTKTGQASPRKNAKAEKSPQKPGGSSTPSLISTQGTTYTAPVSSKPAADEGGLPQDLFEDSERNEANQGADSESAGEKAETETKSDEDKEKLSEEEEETKKIQDEDEDDLLPWFDVGVIKENSITVSHYFNSESPVGRLEDKLNSLIDGNEVRCVNTANPEEKVPLITGHTYRFRVCALNGLGRGLWSETSSYKTCQPGFPSAPSSIRITKSTDGAQLTWEPPSNSNVSGKIVEYSVYLAVKNQSASSADSQLAFMRVYCGPTAECQVPQANLGTAYVDQSNKPAIIFRIAARNEKGYGPATQVRWLQDQQKIPARNSFTAAPGTGFHYQNPHAQQLKRPRFDPQ